jgi:hypothetical protein
LSPRIFCAGCGTRRSRIFCVRRSC